MRPVITLCVILCLMLFSSVDLFAQAAGDYRSNAAAGTWSVPGSWQRFDGSTWVAATSPPDGSQPITIQSTDSMSVDIAVTISNTLSNQGRLGGTSSLTIANGGTYQHDQNNGSIPVCTWAEGSTCKVTGYISGSKPSNANQNFHNFIWDCPGHTANVDLAMSGNTIGGDFTVNNTGSARVQLTSPSSYSAPIAINGNILITAGQFASNGSSSSATIVVNTLGNITVTGGNLSISRGSGTDVTWNLYGNFSVSDATLQNSGGSTRVQKLSFAGRGTHTVTLTNVTYGSSGTGPFTMEVQNGSTVDMGTTVLSASNTGSFLLLAGGMLVSGHADGVNGNIQCTGGSNGGGNSFSPDANYTFNGSAAQVTGSLMPATVNNLTINNLSGVTLSQPTTINGVLGLMAGEFDNTIPFTLGPSGSILYGGGSLKIPVTSVEPPNDNTIPRSFFVDQNYPNPFNPSTAITYGLPKGGHVRASVYNLLGQEIAVLFAGHENAGIHTLHFDASKLGSGVYLCRIQADKDVDIKRMILMK